MSAVSMDCVQVILLILIVSFNLNVLLIYFLAQLLS